MQLLAGLRGEDIERAMPAREVMVVYCDVGRARYVSPLFRLQLMTG